MSVYEREDYREIPSEHPRLKDPPLLFNYLPGTVFPYIAKKPAKGLTAAIMDVAKLLRLEFE